MVFDDSDVTFAFACALIFCLPMRKAITGVVMSIVSVIAAIKIALVSWDVDLG